MPATVVCTCRPLLRAYTSWRSAWPRVWAGHRQRRRMCAHAASSRSRGTFAGTSAAELQEWLERHGVPTSGYGRGQAKSVQELFEEVVAQESVLSLQEDGRPLRRLNVLNLFVMNQQGQVLVEAAQQLPDGRRRERGLVLSEKMLGGEAWRAAAARAVAEELGSVLGPQEGCGGEPQVALEEGSHSVVTECMASSSYPGLDSEYRCHRVRARVPGLPPGPFQTEEQRPGGVLVSFWEWRPLGSLPSESLRSMG